MIAFVVVVVYLLIGWMVAPWFARYADREDIDDPGAFGLLCGLLWFFAVPLGLVMMAISRLSRLIKKRAGVED